MSLTSSTHGAREHARAQGDARAETQPTIPARDAVALPEGVAPGDVIWDETIGAGGYCSHRLPRGARVRLTDVAGDACAALVVHAAAGPVERLNVADSTKVQWNAYLGPGALLLSGMGRVLMSVLEDTSARHDALCGASTPASNAARYGDGAVHGPHPSARERLLLALARHGLGRRDLPPALLLFKGARVAGDGTLAFSGDPVPGAFVTLRADVDVLLSLANAPHRLDPRTEYACTPLRVSAWRGPPAAGDDPLRLATPEARRAFDNTDDHLAGLGARP